MVRFRGVFVLFGLVCVGLPKTATGMRAVEIDKEAIHLDPLLVDTRADDRSYDVTGMGSREAELSEPPFSNDLVMGNPEDAESVAEINLELAMIATTSPADLVAGVSRINLRGFPTPRLRNGFSQSGVPEAVNGSGGDRIQGPLTPVTGKAAPGGIENVMTARPRSTPLRRLSFGASSSQDRSFGIVTNTPVIPKKVWQRWAVGWREKKGPETYSYNRTRSVSGAVTVKHSRAASTMFQVDYTDTHANPGSGVPEYRLSRTSKAIGPYLPLAFFHMNGPGALIYKRVASASLQFEGQPTKAIGLRASAQWFWRSVDEDRFTKGEYLLDERVFAGNREPQHQEQDVRALIGQVEMTARFFALGADHKLLASIDSSRVDYDRRNRGLDTAERAALPATVRRFDPYAPDYFRPELGPSTYRRAITDRTEMTGYTSAILTERMALHQGRTVLAMGLRYDLVGIDIDDRRPTAAKAHIEEETKELTWLAGVNYQLVPSRYLLFANTSTAFEPSTRVDARTNRIQGNETTRGYEVGLKTLLRGRTLTATVLGFLYTNENISRRNPLLDDPIADANQTQPQLVAAGEEEFAGGSLNVRYALGQNWIFTGLATYTRAITTASPDLPEEVGRQLTRLPSRTAVFGARYSFKKGRFKGVSSGVTATYVGRYVFSYEDRNRLYHEYPDYFLLSANASYGWTQLKRKIHHSVGLGVRNLLDRDLVALLARPGQQRTLSVSYVATF